MNHQGRRGLPILAQIRTADSADQIDDAGFADGSDPSYSRKARASALRPGSARKYCSGFLRAVQPNPTSRSRDVVTVFGIEGRIAQPEKQKLGRRARRDGAHLATAPRSSSRTTRATSRSTLHALADEAVRLGGTGRECLARPVRASRAT